MKRAAIVGVLLCLVSSVANGQYFQWNAGVFNAIQAEAVWVNNSGGISVQDLSGSGGQLTVSIPAATGRKVFLMPAFSTFSGGAVLWPGQAATDNNHTPGINVPINVPQAQPVVAAPGLAAIGGQSWTFYVKWTAQSIADAQAKGITGPLYFTAAVFPGSRKRTDGIIQTTGNNYADSTGVAHVTAYGLKAFSPVRACRVDVIFGGKVTGLQGNNGKTYTATMGERIWTNANGQFLQYWDTPWTLNYVTVAPVSWTFTEE